MSEKFEQTANAVKLFSELDPSGQRAFGAMVRGLHDEHREKTLPRVEIALKNVRGDVRLILELDPRGYLKEEM